MVFQGISAGTIVDVASAFVSAWNTRFRAWVVTVSVTVSTFLCWRLLTNCIAIWTIQTINVLNGVQLYLLRAVKSKNSSSLATSSSFQRIYTNTVHPALIPARKQRDLCLPNAPDLWLVTSRKPLHVPYTWGRNGCVTRKRFVDSHFFRGSNAPKRR